MPDVTVPIVDKELAVVNAESDVNVELLEAVILVALPKILVDHDGADVPLLTNT